MFVVKKLALRAFTILRVQLVLGLLVAWAWAVLAPRPACDLDVEKPYGCVWPIHFAYSGFFMQDVWIAGLSLVAGFIAGRVLHKQLRDWGLLTQLFAAVSSIVIMYLAIKLVMSLNDTLIRNPNDGTGYGIVEARSTTSLYLWALVTQTWVVFGSGMKRDSEPEDGDDSSFLLTIA